MKAKKNDENKPRLSNISGEILFGVTRVLNFGEKKYGKYNYRGGMEYTRYYDACMRHILAWLDCEDDDLESGQPHLYHAICSLMMLQTNINDGVGIDDRFKKTTPQKPEEVLTYSIAKVDDIKIGVELGYVTGDRIIPFGAVTEVTRKFNTKTQTFFVFGKCGNKCFVLNQGENHLVLRR